MDDALRLLVARLRDPEVGYVCGQVRFDGAGAATEEGLYWRYEMAVRELESRVGDVTAGNGALYATRRESYLVVDARMDFGREPSATSPHTTISTLFLTPEAC